MKRTSYNWLDDPFDEKKSRADEEQQMSSGSKLALLFGCLGVLVVFVILGVMTVGALASLASEAMM